MDLNKKFAALPWEGKIVYKNNSVPIPNVAITKSFINLVDNTIASLGSDNPTRKVPSENECKRCDINEEDCPERLESNGRQY